MKFRGILIAVLAPFHVAEGSGNERTNERFLREQQPSAATASSFGNAFHGNDEAIVQTPRSTRRRLQDCEASVEGNYGLFQGYTPRFASFYYQAVFTNTTSQSQVSINILPKLKRAILHGILPFLFECPTIANRTKVVGISTTLEDQVVSLPCVSSVVGICFTMKAQMVVFSETLGDTAAAEAILQPLVNLYLDNNKGELLALDNRTLDIVYVEVRNGQVVLPSSSSDDTATPTAAPAVVSTAPPTMTTTTTAPSAATTTTTTSPTTATSAFPSTSSPTSPPPTTWRPTSIPTPAVTMTMTSNTPTTPAPSVQEFDSPPTADQPRTSPSSISGADNDNNDNNSASDIMPWWAWMLIAVAALLCGCCLWLALGGIRVTTTQVVNEQKGHYYDDDDAGAGEEPNEDYEPPPEGADFRLIYPTTIQQQPQPQLESAPVPPPSVDYHHYEEEAYEEGEDEGEEEYNVEAEDEEYYEEGGEGFHDEDLCADMYEYQGEEQVDVNVFELDEEETDGFDEESKPDAQQY